VFLPSSFPSTSPRPQNLPSLCLSVSPTQVFFVNRAADDDSPSFPTSNPSSFPSSLPGVPSGKSEQGKNSPWPTRFSPRGQRSLLQCWGTFALLHHTKGCEGSHGKDHDVISPHIGKGWQEGLQQRQSKQIVEDSTDRLLGAGVMPTWASRRRVVLGLNLLASLHRRRPARGSSVPPYCI